MTFNTSLSGNNSNKNNFHSISSTSVIPGDVEATNLLLQKHKLRAIDAFNTITSVQVSDVPENLVNSNYVEVINNWSIFHDISSCLEGAVTVGSPSGYALDAAGARSTVLLPSPPTSIAMTLSLDKFQTLSIPNITEYSSFEVMIAMSSYTTQYQMFTDIF
jgi:hypothetical protein